LPRRHDGDGDPLAAAGARLARLLRQGWIAKPSPEAQMLASVMFDLRPIGGHFSLFADLQEETLAAASKNSIFVAHMVSNSLKHQPPLGLFRGFATVRSGEHKNTIDLKHNGVVPVTDLGRVYALKGRLTEVNTRARLLAAIEAGSVSATGGRDLIDAYDMIAQTRLEHQAAQIQRARSRTTSWRRPTCRISNAATCATRSSSSRPCRTPPGRAAADT
jgi:CBS domain-containing protein